MLAIPGTGNPSLAWTLHQGPYMLAIPGTGTPTISSRTWRRGRSGSRMRR
jgi:hypothetical protein